VQKRWQSVLTLDILLQLNHNLELLYLRQQKHQHLFLLYTTNEIVQEPVKSLVTKTSLPQWLRSLGLGTNFWEKPELHESRVDLFPVLVCFGRINKVTETLNKTENNLLRNARESFIYTYFLYFVFYIILWHRTIIRRTPLLIFIAVCGRAKSSLRLYGSNRWLRYLYREGANLLYLRHYLVLDFDERELVSQENLKTGFAEIQSMLP